MIATLNQLRACAVELEHAIPLTHSVEELDSLLRFFMRHYELLALPRTEDHIWHRVVKCDDTAGFDNLSRLIYHPTGAVSAGRCNIPGDKVLYGAWNKTTAIEEIVPRIGDTVQFIRYRPRRSVEFFASQVGAYESYYRTGRVFLYAAAERAMDEMLSKNQDRFLHNLYIDSVLTKFFRFPTNKYYFITARIANILHSAVNSGFMYPSVRHAQGLNLSIGSEIFDTHFEIIDTSVEKISFYEYGIVLTEEKKYSASFDAEGNIDWTGRKRIKYRRSQMTGDQEEIYTPGWRKR